MHPSARGSLVCALLIATTVDARQDDAADPAVAAATRVGEYVQQYFAVARAMTAREQVTLQPLSIDLRNEGRERRLVYQIRVEWEPADGVAGPKATVHRELETVDGRKASKGDEEGCLLPESPDPLTILLPEERPKYRFTLAPDPRMANRNANPTPNPNAERERGTRNPEPGTLEYVPVSAGQPSLRWHGDCGTLDLPGLVRGRITIEPRTFAVRRLEQQLVRAVSIPVAGSDRRSGWGDTITVERLEVSTTYQPVRFREPDEVIVLPVEVQRVTVVRTPQPRALRVTQRFSEYRRFSTDARVVPVR